MLAVGDREQVAHNIEEVLIQEKRPVKGRSKIRKLVAGIAPAT